MTKKRAERTHFNTELMPDYMEDRHELGSQNKDRFAMRKHAFDANDIDDIDKLIDKWYSDV